MASETVTIDFELKDHISSKLNDINKGLSSTEGSAKGVSTASAAVGSSMATKMSPALIAGAAALGTVTAAAKVAGDVLVGVVQFLSQSVEAYKEQSDVNNRLEQSIDDAGLSAEQFNEKLQAQIDLINRLAKQTQFGDEAITSAGATLQNLTDVSLESSEGSKLLGLALDIAAGSGKDLETVSKDLAKAQNGEIGTLKEYTSLTKEQQKQLEGIKNAKDRARRALEMLEDTYGGAAVELNRGFYGELKNLQDALGDTRQKIGELIVESGALDPVLKKVNKGFDELQKRLTGNSETIQTFLRFAVYDVTESFISLIDVLEVFAPVIAGSYHALMSMGHAMEFIYDGITLTFGLGLQDAIEKVQGFIRFLEPLGEFSPTIQKIFDNVDKTVGAGVDFTRKRNNELIKDMVRTAESGSQAMQRAIESGLLGEGSTERLKKQLELLRKDAIDVQKDLLTFEKERKKLDDDDDDDDDPPTPPNPDEPNRTAAQISAALERAQIQARRNTLLEFELEMSQAKTDIEKLLLSFERDKFDILTSNLDKTEEELRLKILESETQTRLNELLKEQKELEEELAETQSEKIERLTQEIDVQTQALGSLSNRLSGVSDAGVGAFGDLFDSMVQVGGEFRKLEVGGKGAAQALGSSLSAAGQAAGGFLAEIGLGARETAAIMAIFETAAGFGAAFINPAQAASHFIAAGLYGGIAATGGGTGGSSQGSAGAARSVGGASGGASSSTSSNSANVENILDLQAQKIAEAMKTNGGNQSQIVINLGGANVFSDDPQTYRTLFDGIESEARNRGIMFGGNN